jgi:hypothetical protein
MGAKIQAFDIFQTPLSSHYPLPLRLSCLALPPAWGCELQQVSPAHAEWAILDPKAAQDPQAPGCLSCEDGNIFFSEEEQGFGLVRGCKVATDETRKVRYFQHGFEQKSKS